MQQVEKENIFEDVDVEQVAHNEMQKVILDLIKSEHRPGRTRKKPLAYKVFRSYLRGDNSKDELVGALGYELYGHEGAEQAADMLREALDAVLENAGADSLTLLEDCQVCCSSMSADIDQSLLRLGSDQGGSYWQLHNIWGISQRDLMLHYKEHLLPELDSYITKTRSKEHAERQRVA